MTLAQAKAALRPLGIVLTKKDGEYRVNLYKGREATAYYTSDLDDAVATGKSMARHGNRRRTRHGNTELQPGRFYGYKGHQVWLDRAPGGGYFAMIQGTALEARGATQGEALKKLRAKLDAGNFGNSPERIIIEKSRGQYMVHLDRPTARYYVVSSYPEAFAMAKGMEFSGRVIVDKTGEGFGNRGRRVRHGSAMVAPHYATSTSAAQQAAMRALHLASEHLSNNRQAETYLNVARRLYNSGDFDQARKRALASLDCSIRYAERRRGRRR